MTGTTFYTRTGGNYSTTLYMTYQVTGQSVAGNYSDLTIRAYIKYSGGTKTSSAQSSGYFILNGTTVASNATYSISSGGEHLFGSVSKRVYHNSDGTFPATSISYSCKNYHFGTTSGTGTIPAKSASTIARASSISVNDSTGYYCGSTAYFTISRADSSFTHILYYQLSGGSWVSFQSGATTSGSLSIPTSWESSYMPNSTYMDFTIYCETYSGSTYVGTSSCSCRAVVRTSSVYSISSVSASEAASEMTALNWGVYVTGHSKIKFTVSYSNNSNGASIKSIYWDFNYQSSSGTSNTWTTGTLQYGSTSGQAHTLTVKITDSRGRTATKTFSYTVYSVSAPSITSFQIGRCTSAGVLDNDGTAVKIDSTYTAASTCNGKNSTARKAMYKLSTDSTWTTLGAVTSDSVTFTSVAFDIEKSYDVKVVAYDTFSESEGLTRLSTASNFIQLRSDEKGLALGKYSEQEGLEVNWPAWFNKDKEFTCPQLVETVNTGQVSHTVDNFKLIYEAMPSAQDQSAKNYPFLSTAINGSQLAIMGHKYVSGGNYGSFLALDYNGNAYIFSRNNGSDSLQLLNGMSMVHQSITGFNGGWIFRRCGHVVTVSNTVDLRSLAAGETQNIGTIPLGYRPYDWIYIGPQYGSTWISVRFTLRSDGQIDAYNYGSAITSAVNCYLTASYMTDPTVNPNA